MQIQITMKKEKYRIPEKHRKTSNFTVRFSESERIKLDKFCKEKNTTLTELIRFSLRTIIERAK